MTIADQIQALQTDKTNIANAIVAKGGTVQTGDGFDDFATDIATIPTGITPTGTISITQNGTHDVTNYASANVNVSGGGSSGMLKQGINFVDYDGTLIESWTFAELANKTELPTPPDHSQDTWNGFSASLTNGTWNWTLSAIQEWATRNNNVNQNTFLNVGCLYDVPTTMSDVCKPNCIRLFLTTAGEYKFNICLKLNGTVYIKIDENTSTRFKMTGTNSGSEYYSPKQTLQAGNHVIEIAFDKTVSTNQLNLNSTGSMFRLFCKQGTSNIEIGKMFANAIVMVHGAKEENFNTISSYLLFYCINLKKLNWKGYTISGYFACYNGLKALVIGTEQSSLSTYSFQTSYLLDIVSFPYNCTTLVTDFISYSALEWCSFGNIRVYNNYSLRNVTNIKNLVIPCSTSNTTINGSPFSTMYQLEKITFNNDMVYGAPSSTYVYCYNLNDIEYKGTVSFTGVNAGTSMYNRCYSLRQDKIILPSISITSITSANYMCIYTYNVYELTIPSSWVAIPNNCFQYSGIRKITIPSNITDLGTNCFAGCFQMMEIKFESSTPPTASNANWYTNLPKDCKILVPSGSLSAYTSATNYPSSSTYTYEEY